MALLALAALIYSAATAAECSRSDIEYYLDKGFSQEQITSLCTFTPEAAPKYTPYQERARQDTAGQPQVDEAREEQEDFLKRAISAYDVKLTPDSLLYSQKKCFQTGLSPNVDERLKACPEVKYDIGLKGLTVRDSSKQFFLFGDESIGVEGNITQRIVGNFSNYPEQDRKKLIDKFKGEEADGEADIPIREDIPVSRVVQTLRDLSS